MEATEAVQKSSSPFFRVITWGVGLLLIVALVGIVVQQFGFVASQQHRTIEELLSHFRSGGLPVGKPQEVADAFGASRRVRVPVGGQTVDLMVFLMDDVEQAARLDQIRQQRSLAIEGLQQPVEVNGNFVLAGYADHPRAAEVTRSFRGFGVSDDAVHPLPMRQETGGTKVPSDPAGGRRD